MNQPSLYKAIEEYFTWAESDSIEQKLLLKHGR